MEAQRRDIAVSAERTAIVRGPERMRGVVHDAEPVPSREVSQALDVARIPVDVRRDDRGGPIADERLRVRGRQCQRVRLDVGEYGSTALPGEAGRGCDVRERGGDHLASQVERAEGELQGDRSVGHEQAMLHAEWFGELSLELDHERAGIREVVACPDAPQHRHVLLERRQRRPADRH